MKMNRNNKLHTGKGPEGFVLVLTLFAALIMSALIIAYVNIQTIDLNLIKNNLGSKKAYYIAEAGLADAFNEIRLNGPLADTQWEKTFPPNTSSAYSVSVFQNSTVITSTGFDSASNFSRTLEVLVRIPVKVAPPHFFRISQFKEITW